MKVEVDDSSGFCFGVVNAISKAEECLASGGALVSLGDIVHNGAEVARLEALGLEVAPENADLSKLAGRTVLIRAHGEPPETYLRAREYGITLIDATCPVVARLQKTVAEAHAEMSRTGGRVVIFGRRGHAEVKGLVGQVCSREKHAPAALRSEPDSSHTSEYAADRTPLQALHLRTFDGNMTEAEPETKRRSCSVAENEGKSEYRAELCTAGMELDPNGSAILPDADVEQHAGVTIVENEADLDTLDFARPIYFLAQTTSSLAEFRRLGEEIKRRAVDPAKVVVHDTVCRQVSGREEHLAEFARRVDVVIFVSGAKSSNGRVLFEATKTANPRSHKIENAGELRPGWFEGAASVGVCGATSTPRWLMERVAKAIGNECDR